MLGEADPGVAAAAFGVFEPGAVVALLESARAEVSLAQIRRARAIGAVTALRAVIGDPPGVAEIVAALRRGLAEARPLGRAFFTGMAGLPWPEDPLGQLWQACALLREYRGDGHLAACVAAGLDGVEANMLTELYVGWSLTEYTASRAWSPEVMAAAAERLRARGLLDGEALSEEGRAFRAALEDTTDATVREVVAAIGGELAGIVAQTGAWSDEIIARGWFPPDPYKRAAG